MDDSTRTMHGDSRSRRGDPVPETAGRLTSWGPFELREGPGRVRRSYRAWDSQIAAPIGGPRQAAASGPGVGPRGYESMLREARLTRKVRIPTWFRSTEWICMKGGSAFGPISSGPDARRAAAVQGSFAAREAALIGIGAMRRSERGARRGAAALRYQAEQCHARSRRPDSADGFRHDQAGRQRRVSVAPCSTWRRKCSPASRLRWPATSTRWARCCSNWSRARVRSSPRRA